MAEFLIMNMITHTVKVKQLKLLINVSKAKKEGNDNI